MSFSCELKKGLSWLVLMRPKPSADRSAVALFIYIALFPILLFFGLLLPPDWQRFAFQWQALGLTIFVATSVFFSDSTTRDRYWSWFLPCRVSLLVLLALVYLAVMAARHGIALQQDSLASGFLFASLSPVLFWTCVAGVTRIHRFLLAFLLVGVLFAENIFLTVYLLAQSPLNVSSLIGDNLPRIFINVRDGDTWAIAASVVAFSLTVLVSERAPTVAADVLRSRIFVAAVSVWFLVFLSGWITQGRGLFVSVLCAVLLSFLRDRSLNRFLLVAPLALGFALSFLASNIISLSVCGFAGCRDTMMVRFLGDAAMGRYGRLDIWSAWIRSGLEVSMVWGHGLGGRPERLSFQPVYTPHNIFVQIFADSGLWGFFVSVLLASFIVLTLKRIGFRVGRVGLYALVVTLVYLSVSSVLFWAAGAWLVTLVPMSFQKKEEPFRGSSSVQSFPISLLCVFSSACMVSLIVMLVGKALVYAAI